MSLEFLRPDWPAIPGVHAATTLRSGGVSRGSLASLNLGQRVGDEPAALAENLLRVSSALCLPGEPLWLQQVHGMRVLDAGPPHGDAAATRRGLAPTADAIVTRRPGLVCAIQSADCLPVLLAAADGSVIGAAHAGWRGLAAGVLEETVASMGAPPSRLHAWLGPAIGPAHFEVGDEVVAAFREGQDEDQGENEGRAGVAFQRNARGRWQCDLYALARRRLARLGIRHVRGGGRCTYAEADSFFSYRRDPGAGRMATFIWIDRRRAGSDAGGGRGAAG